MNKETVKTNQSKMDEKTIYRATLEKYSYRDLQALATALCLSSNLKKCYLVQLIYAKKYGSQSEVNSIITKAKLERKQMSKNKKRNCKTLKIQCAPGAAEDGSTIGRHTDRVLRSSNTKRDGTNSSVPMDLSVDAPSTEKQKGRSQSETIVDNNYTLEHSPTNETIDEDAFMKKPALQFKPNMLRSKKQVTPIVRNVNPTALLPLKQQGSILYQVKTQDRAVSANLKLAKTSAFKHTDRKYSNTNNTILKSKKNIPCETITSQNSYSNDKVIVQDIVDYSIESQTLTKSRPDNVFAQSSTNYKNSSTMFKQYPKSSKHTQPTKQPTNPILSRGTEANRSYYSHSTTHQSNVKFPRPVVAHQNTYYPNMSACDAIPNIVAPPPPPSCTQTELNSYSNDKVIVQDIVDYSIESQTLKKSRPDNVFAQSSTNYKNSSTMIKQYQPTKQPTNPILSRGTEPNISYYSHSTAHQSNVNFPRPVMAHQNTYYPNMSACDAIPNIVAPPPPPPPSCTQTEHSTPDHGDNTVYHHEEDPTDPLMVQPTSVATTTARETTVLPNFSDAFKEFENCDFTWPFSVDDSKVAEGLLDTSEQALSCLLFLEDMYKFNTEDIPPLESNQQANIATSSSNDTHFASVLPSVTTAAQSSPLPSFQSPMLSYADTGDYTSQANDFVMLQSEQELAMSPQNHYGVLYADTDYHASQANDFVMPPPNLEQALTPQNYNRVFGLPEAGTSLKRQDYVYTSTNEELMNDALEFISEDTAYLDRLTMDEKMQCMFCSWAGPQFVLEVHIMKNHADMIQKPSKGEWNVTYRLGSLMNQGVWLSQVAEFDSRLYLLSVKYQDPDRFLATLTTLESQLGKTGSVTVYNKVTGEPYTWEGEIQEFSASMPYYNDKAGLEINELSKLELLPDRANLKLLNGELVLASPSKAVVGRPELNDTQITLFVKVNSD